MIHFVQWIQFVESIKQVIFWNQYIYTDKLPVTYVLYKINYEALTHVKYDTKRQENRGDVVWDLIGHQVKLYILKPLLFVVYYLYMCKQKPRMEKTNER